MPDSNTIANIDNSYARLPENFYERIAPTKVSNPELIKFNHKLAQELGLNLSDQREIANIFSGNEIPKAFEPIAQAYAGHQFGHFVPQLGDGRAVLLAEIITPKGIRRDLQLKGSGPTSFSRSGDGRACLGPVLREYLVSEAMHALGVPSTRALAVVSTGEDVYRETPLPGAVLSRIAASHIRVGTFEYFAARQDFDSVKTLADYVIDRHYGYIKDSDNPYISLLSEVLNRQIKLISKWMSFGFVHGVMNTDNMTVSGETIDYGPCAFMDFYDPNIVFSSIDHYGRYAYSEQFNIALWNLSCFASSILNLIDNDKSKAIEIAKEILESAKNKFEESYSSLMLEKIGIEQGSEADKLLLRELLDIMHESRADFTLSFRYLARSINDPLGNADLISLFDSGKRIKEWLSKWHLRINETENKLNEISILMNQVNPAFIPRNHRIEEVITDAYTKADFTLLNKLSEALSKPYTEENNLELMQAPQNKDQIYRTHCGT